MRCKLKSFVHLRYYPEVLAVFWQKFGMVRGAVWLLNDGVLSYSCPKAVRSALSARLSLLIGCYFSEDVLESSDIVEIYECEALCSRWRRVWAL